MNTDHRPIRFAALMLAAALLTACNVVNPFQYATTPLDKAHVALSVLETAQNEVLALVHDQAIPDQAKTALRKASHDATLAASELAGATVEVEAARAELIAAGGSNTERLRVANERLLQWTQTVLARIKSIDAVVKEARHV